MLMNETCHQFKRIYLIVSSILSLSLPLLHIDIAESTALYSASLPEIQISQVIPDLPFKASLWQITMSVYLMIATILIARFINQILKMIMAINAGKVVDHGSYKLVLIQGDIAPSSFMNYIFWDETKKLSTEEEQVILQHEFVHVRASIQLTYFILNYLKYYSGLFLWCTTTKGPPH